MDYQPSFGSESTTQDNLIAGDFPAKSLEITVDTGNLVRGTLLGKITRGVRTAVGAADVPAPAGATISASPVATTAAELGVHRFVCITTGATGEWNHFNPAGELVGVATTGTEYTGGGLTLTITDSGTDPALGEALKVTVTAAAASGKYVQSLAAATDGSQTPVAILAEDANATDGDVVSVAYVSGEFNSRAIAFGTGHTAASTKDALQALNIYLRDSVAA